MSFESPVDIEESAEQLDVEPGALRALVNNFDDHDQQHCPEAFPGLRIGIEQIHAFDNGLAVVTLTDEINHVVGGNAPLALVDVAGYVFPFHPNDVEFLDALREELPDELRSDLDGDRE